ncbi:MAG: hypothetical protein ABJL99_15195 [Aliishimia sp.]
MKGIVDLLAGFLPFEHWQNIGTAPVSAAVKVRPVVIVLRLATHINHAVHRQSATKNAGLGHWKAQGMGNLRAV